MNLNEAKQLLSMHGYILENNKHDIAKGIENLFNSFNDIDFKKGKLEKAIEKW